MKSAVSKDQLLELLVESGKLNRDRVEELAGLSRLERKTIFQVLMEKDIIKEDDMIDFLCQHVGFPTINLLALRIPKEVIGLLPKKIAERHQVIPISKVNNFLTAATANPFDLLVKDDLKEITHCDVCFVLVPPRMIMQAIDNYYAEASNLDQILEGIDENSLQVIRSKDEEGDGSGLEEFTRGKTAEAPVVRMVNLILDEGIRTRASDIHFEPYEKDFRIRYRVDGALKESFSHAREMYPAIVARVKIISQLDMTQKRLPQDGRFRVKVQDREIDFRVSMLPTYYGEKIVLRVLDRSGVKAGLEKLGFNERPTDIFARAIKRPYGMILVTGPTGSGKSTTLYSIMNSMNTPDRNIMTVEDPVEYQVQGITQTQVNGDVGLTFAIGLRSLLRQSPDVILVGEIRDSETADIAVKAALTGHLVFSTLHTNSASGAMTRLVDMGVEPFLISSSVICVAAQRLMRRICDHCKAPYEVPDELLKRCHLDAAEIRKFESKKGKGCAKCNKSGYYGRLGAIEVLQVSPRIREMIIQRKSSDAVHRVAREEGMESLYENALGHFKKGVTTLEEVLRVTSPD